MGLEDIQNKFARIRELAKYARINYYQRVYGANGAQRYQDNIEARMNRKGIGLNDQSTSVRLSLWYYRSARSKQRIDSVTKCDT